MSNLVALNALKGAAGATGDSGVYIDDVFSTTLYDGSGSARSIVNGLDLAGKGGLVWIKNRESTASREHTLSDTERGAGKVIHTNGTGAQGTGRTDLLSSFNDNGFSIGGSDQYTNASGHTYVAWNFAKQKKFFDIVTWTGDDVQNRTIAHNLASVPGCIIVKCTSTAKSWKVYHRGLNNGSSPEDYNVELDNTAQQSGPNAQPWNETAPTSTHFTVNGDASQVNGDGLTYVAYLFAHHDGDGNFGPDGDKDAIKCGTYTGNGGSLNVNLGWEPQWLLLKNYDGYNASWQLFDNMRGVGTADIDDCIARPDLDGAEINQDRISFQGNGFRTTENDSDTDANGHKFIYIAIRKKDGVVGKLAEAGTDVFAMDTGNDSSTIPCFDSGFPVDFAFRREPGANDDWYISARGIENRYVRLNSGAAMATDSKFLFDHNAGYHRSRNSDHQAWMFRQHQGLDLSFYRGNGLNNNDKHHNLGRVPEMIWCKCLDAVGEWTIYHKDLNDGTNPHDYRLLFSTAEEGASDDWGGAGKTALVFDVSGEQNVNNSNDHYMAICFASVDGICKVGSYSGSSSAKTITTGFQPRFVILKAATSAQHWYLLDTLRGWGSGDDKEMKPNATNAQQDYDIGAPTSTGFTLTVDTAWNSSGIRYIYYAHA